MALSWVWTVLMLLSVSASVWTGRTAEVGAAALAGATRAVELMLSLAGPLLLWSGLMGVLERSGVSRALGRRLGPVLRRLFPLLRCDFVFLRHGSTIPSLSSLDSCSDYSCFPAAVSRPFAPKRRIISGMLSGQRKD